MSQRKIKRARKEIRRRVDENFGQGLEALAKMVRPRPRFIPKAVWGLVYIPLFTKRYRRAIYKHLN